MILAWPIVAAAATLGGQIYQGWQSRKNVRDTHELREQLAEKQYERMQKDIKEMKEYNTPKAQMKRFEEAGLNKNLIYQQGQPGLQKNYAQYQPYEVDFSSRMPYVQDVGSVIGSYQDTKRFMSQQSIRENEAEFRELLRNSDIDYKKAHRELVKLNEEIDLNLNRQDLTFEQMLHEAEKRNLTELQKAFQMSKNWYGRKGIDITSGSNVSVLMRMLMNMGEHVGIDPDAGVDDPWLDTRDWAMPEISPRGSMYRQYFGY